jgi:CHASE3 domain sensor protein
MDGGEEIQGLLREIRDLEREHLAEYRRVSQEILSLQNGAVARQEVAGRVYRRVVLFGGALVGILLLLLSYLLTRWSGQLFR